MFGSSREVPVFTLSHNGLKRKISGLQRACAGAHKHTALQTCSTQPIDGQSVILMHLRCTLLIVFVDIAGTAVLP